MVLSWTIASKGIFTYLATFEKFSSKLSHEAFQTFGLWDNIYTNFSLLVNVLVIISSILGYFAVKGLNMLN